MNDNLPPHAPDNHAPDNIVPDPCAGLTAIHAQIASAAREAGRDPAEVTLIAVSKTHPAAAVQQLLHCGQRTFGENRVQEAAQKFPPLQAAWPDLRLHLIGPLQTNKLREAVALFDRIDSLDRPRVADALEQTAQSTGRLPRLLIQVNIGDEPQKSGVTRAGADLFIRQCRQRFGANLAGLMCIPPQGQDPTPYFRDLTAMAHHHGLATISMGMSGDFISAIKMGATEIRVGSALFGQRN